MTKDIVTGYWTPFAIFLIILILPILPQEANALLESTPTSQKSKGVPPSSPKYYDNRWYKGGEETQAEKYEKVFARAESRAQRSWYAYPYSYSDGTYLPTPRYDNWRFYGGPYGGYGWRGYGGYPYGGTGVFLRTGKRTGVFIYNPIPYLP